MTPMLTSLAIYLLLGAFAGTLAGLFGIGGGLIIVPVLIFSFHLQGIGADVVTHMAIGTSLATIVFTSMSSIRTHHLKGGVRWDLFRPMTLGIVLGAALGAVTASALSGLALQRIIGVFAVVIAIRMALNMKPRVGGREPGGPVLAGAGAVIGWASALFGIGGGSLSVPFLARCNVPMQQAVGTSAACGLPIAVAGALTNVGTGWGEPGLPAYAAGFVYLPAMLGIVLTSVPFARLGALLAHRLPPLVLKRTFALLLLVVGIRLLLK